MSFNRETNEKRQCPLCGENELERRIVYNYEYKSSVGVFTFEGEIVFEYCQNCREEFIPGRLIDKWHRQILETLSVKFGIFTPAELSFIYSALPYTMDELAKSLDIDCVTLIDYRNGTLVIVPGFCESLKLLIIDFIVGMGGER